MLSVIIIIAYHIYLLCVICIAVFLFKEKHRFEKTILQSMSSYIPALQKRIQALSAMLTSNQNHINQHEEELIQVKLSSLSKVIHRYQAISTRKYIADWELANDLLEPSLKPCVSSVESGFIEVMYISYRYHDVLPWLLTQSSHLHNSYSSSLSLSSSLSYTTFY